MRTWINHREDGSVSGFDISAIHSTTTVARVLKSVPGIGNVRRQWFAVSRLTFTYHGVPCNAFEMFGDNSHITIGAKVATGDLDWEPVRLAFERSRGGALLVPAAVIVAALTAILAAFIAWTRSA